MDPQRDESDGSTAHSGATAAEPGRTAYVLGLRVVQELWLAGVRDVVLAPGSRSAPLALALHAADEDGDLRLHVRVDERSAGFLALGLATGSRRPVAVVTTSGTAVGNLLPAVMEAHHTGRRLVVVSADRPDRLRGTGANQTTEQAGIFGVFAPCHDLTATRRASRCCVRRWPTPARGRARPSSTSSSTAACCRRTPTATPGGPGRRASPPPRTASTATIPPRRTSAACGRRAPQRSRHGWTGASDDAAPARSGRAPSWSPATAPDRPRGCSPRRRTGRSSPSRRREPASAVRRIRTGRLLLDHRPARRHRARRRRRPPDPLATGHRPHQRPRARGARRARAGWRRHRSRPRRDGARRRADGRRAPTTQRWFDAWRDADDRLRRPHRPTSLARRPVAARRRRGRRARRRRRTRRSSSARPTRCATSTSWRPRGHRTSTASSSATAVSPASTAWCRPRWASPSAARARRAPSPTSGTSPSCTTPTACSSVRDGAAPRPHPRRAERRRRRHLRHARAGRPPLCQRLRAGLRHPARHRPRGALRGPPHGIRARHRPRPARAALDEQPSGIRVLEVPVSRSEPARRGGLAARARPAGRRRTRTPDADATAAPPAAIPSEPVPDRLVELRAGRAPATATESPPPAPWRPATSSALSRARRAVGQEAACPPGRCARRSPPPAPTAAPATPTARSPWTSTGAGVIPSAARMRSAAHAPSTPRA